MAEKTALYFMVDWVAIKNKYKNYNMKVLISIITLPLSSFFIPIRSDKIGERIRSYIAHKKRYVPL